MISKNKNYVLMVFSIFMCIYTNAQTGNKRVSGVVVDANNVPVLGATILLKDTNRGTVTDFDGAFNLEVPEKGTLVISYIGYLTQEVAVTAQSNYSITLREDSMQLNEVVVVGYGSMRKKDLTGAITQIRPEEIADENPNTVQDILRGTPGLQVGFSNSAKGGGSLQIRGQRSVYTAGNHNSPLLVLDGMIFYGELSEINPDDIGQIDILKDASAAAVFGAKAANGVIIITTKKGKKGKPKINFTTNTGVSQITALRERWSPDDYLRHRQDWFETGTYGVNYITEGYEAYQVGQMASRPGYYTNPNNLSSNVTLEDWRAYTQNDAGESDLSIWAQRLGIRGNALENLLTGKTVDWSDHAFRTGFNQDYNVSVSGAGDNSNYYFSMGYLSNQGVVVSDNYGAIRSNLKLNLNVTDWLEVGANINFQDRTDGNVNINLGATLQNSPFADYTDADGNPIQYPFDDSYTRRGYNFDFNKKFAELESGYTTLNSIFNVKVKLPLNITYTFNAAPRYQFYYNRYFTSADLPFSNPKDRGVDRNQSKRFNWSLNNIIEWDHTFNDKHHFILTLVQEAEELQYWSDDIYARNIQPSDALGFHNTQNGTKEDSSYSSSDSYQTADALLGRLFYSFDNRYMITGSIRRDGYSAFGGSNPYALFPSLSASWNFTNEGFYKWGKVLDYGKLRFSYGKNGNRSLGSPYLALANLSAGAGKMQGYLNASGDEELYRYLIVDRMANPNLQWEKTASWNVGLDFGFLDGRIGGSIEYYYAETQDMIMAQRLPEFTGFSNITTNLGQVNNSGIEFTLNTENFNKENFKWNTSLGFFYNKNEIKHLYYEYENGVEVDDISNGWFIDEPISAIWDYKVTGIWQKDEVEEAAIYGQKPGDPKVANIYTEDDIINNDGSVTPVYNNNDKVILGQSAPPINWSLRNNFTFWKNLSFSFNLYSYIGHKSLNGDYLNDDDHGSNMSLGFINLPEKHYWTVDNPSNTYGRIGAVGPTGAQAPGRLIDRSFIRLENITIGYTFPEKWTSKYSLDRLKIFAALRNVATWEKEWEYGDPETGSFAPRICTLGLNVTF